MCQSYFEYSIKFYDILIHELLKTKSGLSSKDKPEMNQKSHYFIQIPLKTYGSTFPRIFDHPS